MEGSSPPWVEIFLCFFAFFNYFFDFYYMVIEGPLAPNFFMSTLYWPLLSFHVKIIKNWDLHLVMFPCKALDANLKIQVRSPRVDFPKLRFQNYFPKMV